jgi:hypothetical protein
MDCIAFLQEHGTHDEGLFRMSASSDQIIASTKQIMRARGSIEEGTSCHVVSGVLKLLLRELPETILTNRFYEYLTKSPPPTSHAVQSKVVTLPDANREVLDALFALMVAVASNEAETKMDLGNLGTCLTPALSRKDHSIVEHMALSFDPLFRYYEEKLNFVRPKKGVDKCEENSMVDEGDDGDDGDRGSADVGNLHSITRVQAYALTDTKP